MCNYHTTTKDFLLICIAKCISQIITEVEAIRPGDGEKWTGQWI
jgi:hypothetical protein